MEILAPAGSMEALQAALRCGADAVYIGGKDFSARQNAQNFSNDEIKLAVDLCHLYGSKIYIAVNTMLLDNQLELFKSTISEYAKFGVDALIVQDLGAVCIIKDTIPSMPIHASTQMTIHSINGAKFAKKIGLSRIVLSRELDKTTINEISNLGIETEIFSHGALCMSVSGQCYFSSLIGSRSANRGLCAGTCRLPFSTKKTKDFYALSLKDLSLINHIEDIKKMNITSLKIEGRMKRPEYVASTVKSYKSALSGDLYDLTTLSNVFSRSGFTDGYFTNNLNNMFGTRNKEDVAASNSVLNSIKNYYNKEAKISPIEFNIIIQKNKPIELHARDNKNNNILVYGDLPEVAQNKSIDHIFIQKQLEKLGDTIYYFKNLMYTIEDGLSIPSSSINKLRRYAVSMLNEERIRNSTPHHVINTIKLIRESNEKKSEYNLRLKVQNKDQLKKVDLSSVEKIIFPMEYLLKSSLNIDLEKIIIEPPRFIYNEKFIEESLNQLHKKGFQNILCNNIAYIYTAQKIGFNLYGDFSLNIANSASLSFLSNHNFIDCTVSFEQKAVQISNLTSNIPYGIISYGNLPVMLIKNCPIKNEIGCTKCPKCIYDRTNRSFQVVCHEKKYIEILNSDVLYIPDKLNDFKNISFIRLDFNLESSETVYKVVEDYKNQSNSQKNTTRGLYYRGIL